MRHFGAKRGFNVGTFSIWHWLIVLLVVIMIFGTKKLRNMGSDLGGAVKGFKDGMKDGKTAEEAAKAEQVADQSAAAASKTTIDVDAKQKA